MSYIDISSSLGEYMLKGWVLTDRICSNVSCSVPLMRSPTGQIPLTFFCANCDGGPVSERSPPQAPLPAVPPPRQSSPSVGNSSVTSTSRVSTPPTEVSSTLSSPTFAAPVDTPEARLRREQSDAASAEIGKRLLKGWAMLADECPNPRCFGVPLVRAPQAGGGKNPRKECVACEAAYVSETDDNGWERLVVVDSPDLRLDRAIRLGTNRGDIDSQHTPHAGPSSLGLNEDAWEKVTPVNASRNAGQKKPPAPESSSTVISPMMFSSPELPKTTSNQVLAETTQSLELALQSLSQRLTALSSNATLIDPNTIAQTTDVIGKILHTLMQVQQLRGRNPS